MVTAQLLSNFDLCHCAKPPQQFGSPIRSNTKQAVTCIQPQKKARCLRFWIYEEEGLYYLCSKNKGTDQISFAVAAILVCAFVFAYSNCWFSDVVADFLM